MKDNIVCVLSEESVHKYWQKGCIVQKQSVINETMSGFVLLMTSSLGSLSIGRQCSSLSTCSNGYR